jgi:16S rRNA (guanine527-N7)-methyltransferase
MDSIDFWTTCAGNGIILDKRQMDTMERFHNELSQWNERVNLISRKDIEHIYDRHILHSLALVKYCSFPDRARCLDVGTGGGFPGIPLKIALPELKMVLVDSIAKKIKVTGMFAQHTGLRDITAMTTRAEALADKKEFRRSFDVVVSRAVAPLVQLVSWVESVITPKAQIAVLKGGDLEAEIAETTKKFPTLSVTEIPIDMVGAPWFKEDEKKILLCQFS